MPTAMDMIKMKVMGGLMSLGPAPAIEVGELKSKIGYLSAMDLFRGLTMEEMKEVDRATVMHTAPAGRVIHTPGETREAIFLLKKGAVQIYKMSSEGRKLVISQIGPMSFFGEMGCIGQGMYNTFAETVKESLICTMSRADVQRLLLSKPKIALSILEVMGRRMMQAEQQLEEVAFKGMIPRLAALLLREAEGDEVKGLTHQDIAERLGAYRETTTNALNELKRAGIVALSRKLVVIKDRRRLERAAAEE
ncbi:MAG: Crp/Fnr family transcriptional regulator [Acidobacteria bacterium]|nr:Crp/Fnr family transcriptional regulator [Acidobacteriota bacterium]